MQKSQGEKDSAKIYIGAGLVGTLAAEKNMMLMTVNWWHGHWQGHRADTHWHYISLWCFQPEQESPKSAKMPKLLAPLPAWFIIIITIITVFIIKIIIIIVTSSSLSLQYCFHHIDCLDGFPSKLLGNVLHQVDNLFNRRYISKEIYQKYIR